MPDNPAQRKVGNVRWLICGLLFFATTVNYVDRQVLSILKPTLMAQYSWSETTYGLIVLLFQLAYALMMPVVGRIIDRIGTRAGYAIAVVLWSLAAASHALARGAWTFGFARFALGITEAANFPAAVRTVSDWFPQKERSFATGIFNSGSNVGVIIAALTVPYLTAQFGWQAAFVLTGAIGCLWVVPWLLWFRKPSEHPWISPAEREYIQHDSAPQVVGKVATNVILRHGAAWAFIVGKLLTDPVWWFYSFWIPGFLKNNYGVDLTSIGKPLVIIYVLADFGSIGGGWLFSGMRSRGWTPNRSRKTAMLICALMATPVISMFYIKTLWPAVIVLGLAAAAHQGWSANLFTMTSDAFPQRAVASVVGLGGMSGGIGSMLISFLVGFWLDLSNKSYGPIFVVAGTTYLVALLVIHKLVPNLELLEPGVFE